MRLYLFLLLLFPLSISAQNTKFHKFKALHCPEKIWVMMHPFIAGKALKISENTRRIAKEMKNDPPMDGYENGGKADAFRHAFWMASLTQKIRWRKAYKLGKAHEKGNKIDFKKNKTEEGILPDAVSCEMDIWNNKVGVEIGRINKSAPPVELIKLVKQSIFDGKCKIIKMDIHGNYIDESGGEIPDEEWQGKWENKRCLVNSDIK